MAFLRSVVEDSSQAKTYDLPDDFCRLGRQPSCEIVLDNNAVSREHARIVHENDRYYLEDLHSRNGTFLNGLQIASRTPLVTGDRINICGQEFYFFDESEPLDSGVVKAIQVVGNVVVADDAPSDHLTIKSSIRMGQGHADLPNMAKADADVKLRALIDIGRNLGAQVDQVLPQLLCNLLKIFLQADCAYILLTDKQTKRLDLKAFKHRDPNNRESFRVSRTILEKVVATKAAILSDDVANDSRFDPSESIVNYNIYSIMAAPIMDFEQAEVLGVVQVDARTAGKKFTYEDLDLLVSVAYQLAVSYQNALMQEVVITEKMIERELQVAHKVQISLLPIEHPKIVNYEFFDFYQPARFLGGDYYDYIPLPDGRLVLTLGDVSGKGVAASLFMSKLSAEVRTGLLLETTLGATIHRLNRIYSDERWESRFITFFFGVLDPKTNVVTFFNAGHMPPVLCDGAGNAVTLAEDKIGLPLGVMEDSLYEEHSLTIEDGQTLVVFSDGLSDAMNAAGEYFGMNGVMNQLRKTTVSSVREFGDNLINAVHSFVGRTPQTDDQSVLIFGRRDQS